MNIDYNQQQQNQNQQQQQSQYYNNSPDLINYQLPNQPVQYNNNNTEVITLFTPPTPTVSNMQQPNDGSVRPQLNQQQSVLMPDLTAMRRAKEIKDLGAGSNMKQLAESSFELLIDCFKVVMASMLSIFVPQECPLLQRDIPQSNPICFSNPTGLYISNTAQWDEVKDSTHDCSLEENFIELTPFNKFCLGWNFITLLFMISHYILTWRRERFCINKLEVSVVDTKIHLSEIIKDYPHLESRLYWYNKYVFTLSIWCIVCQFINIIASGTLVFRDYYAGFRSATGFITNILITATVMQRAADNTWLGMKHKLAYSCSQVQPVSYNSIDPKFKPQNQVELN